MSLLAHSSLPAKYRDEAVLTAVHFLNRLVTPVLCNKSPYEMLYNVKPDYAMLKIFGCLCYPLIRPYNRNQLDFKSVACVFIGFSSKYKGFKCLDPKSGKIYISRNVKF